MPRGPASPATATATATATARKRLARFTSRKEMLRNKARDLVARCGVDVAVVCTGPDGAGDLDWPSKEAVNAVVRRYNALEPAQRARHREDLADVVAGKLGEEREKLARARQGGVAGAFASYDDALQGMSEVKLRELLATIEGSLAAARRRALKLQAPPAGAADRATFLPGLVHEEEAPEEDSVSATNNGVPPPTEPRGEAGAGGGGLVLPPPGRNPNPPNAVPVDAGADDDVAENIVTGEDPGDEVQILQPPGDANGTEWMRSLVDELKKQPQPYNPAADAAGIEYINVGSFFMERDAYDFIRFDLGMPPPCGVPNSFDEDEDGGGGDPLKFWPWDNIDGGGGGDPLKLWSWDNTMPPPLKQACATWHRAG